MISFEWTGVASYAFHDKLGIAYMSNVLTSFIVASEILKHDLNFCCCFILKEDINYQKHTLHFINE